MKRIVLLAAAAASIGLAAPAAAEPGLPLQPADFDPGGPVVDFGSSLPILDFGSGEAGTGIDLGSGVFELGTGSASGSGSGSASGSGTGSARPPGISSGQ
ncbi:hypothetical protein ACTD5D_09165 [Nocardia takedensis]|uniref:hypothetical protein n=1 Tax=Nocardia takedensis TaxID=259390 RepID=UPI00030712B9|nr:hypothetical protein [Nocardia takedensis]